MRQKKAPTPTDLYHPFFSPSSFLSGSGVMISGTMIRYRENHSTALK